MGIKKVSEANQDGEHGVIVGWLSNVTSDGGGFLLELTDDDGQIEVQVRGSLANSFEIGKFLSVSGTVRVNKGSGRRWIVAESIDAVDPDTMTDETASKIKKLGDEGDAKSARLAKKKNGGEFEIDPYTLKPKT